MIQEIGDKKRSVRTSRVAYLRQVLICSGKLLSFMGIFCEIWEESEGLFFPLCLVLEGKRMKPELIFWIIQGEATVDIQLLHMSNI